MGQGPEGWKEVFRGPCLEADVVQAVLEAAGLAPVTRRLGFDRVWSGSVFEDCRVYVPGDQAEEAETALAERTPDQP